MNLYAVGDIHGCYSAFEELLSQINLDKTDTLVLLGDYINKGSESKAVVDRIIALKAAGYKVITLRGNHEQMLLNARKNPQARKLFRNKGGKETLKNFKVDRVEDLPVKYLVFFNELLFYYAHDHFLFVHGGFNEKLTQPFDDKYFMLWKCNKNYTYSALKDKTIIHGHCPISDKLFNDQFNNSTNNINLDTGCVYGPKGGFGRLTAYECFSGKVFQVT